jgi:hypothetical protein
LIFAENITVGEYGRENQWKPLLKRRNKTEKIGGIVSTMSLLVLEYAGFPKTCWRSKFRRNESLFENVSNHDVGELDTVFASTAT